jgi:hypothetical protein
MKIQKVGGNMKKFLILLMLVIYSPALAEEFKIVHFTDTHNLLGETRLNVQTQWIADNAISENIKFVIHTGDFGGVGGDYGDLILQGQAASALSILDGVVPYAVALGNHDYDSIAEALMPSHLSTVWQTAFPATVFSTQSGFGGIESVTKFQNMHFTFTVDGETFLVITADFMPTQATADWIDSILAANTDKIIIYATHYYMTGDFTSVGVSVNKRETGHGIADPSLLTGNQIYQTVLRKYSNILFSLSGHWWDDNDPHKVGGSRTIDVINGHAINQIRANFQLYEPVTEGTIDNTYFRLITIDTETDIIQVQSFSPENNSYSTDYRDNFYLSRITDLGFVQVENVILEGITIKTE